MSPKFEAVLDSTVQMPLALFRRSTQTACAFTVVALNRKTQHTNRVQQRMMNPRKPFPHAPEFRRLTPSTRSARESSRSLLLRSTQEQCLPASLSQATWRAPSPIFSSHKSMSCRRITRHRITRWASFGHPFRLMWLSAAPTARTYMP
jgi:hypothetical protein